MLFPGEGSSMEHREKMCPVILPTEEGEEQGKMTRRGKARVREFLAAYIPLNADEGP
jgi:hypothetical protein